MKKIRREELSPKILTALYACKYKEITLSKLSYLIGRLWGRRIGKRLQYFPIYLIMRLLWRGIRGKREMVKKLRKFKIYGIVSISNEELFDRMLFANSNSEFKKVWENGGKDIQIMINKAALLELAPEEKEVKEAALKLLEEDSGLSVGKALSLAKKKLKRLKRLCPS